MTEETHPESPENPPPDPKQESPPNPWGKTPSDPGQESAPDPWKKSPSDHPREDSPGPWKKSPAGPELEDEPSSSRGDSADPADPAREDEAPLWQGEPPGLPEEEVLIPVDADPEDVTAGWSRRRRNRSAAIQFLYAWELNRPEDLCDALDEFFSVSELVRDDFVFAEELIRGTTDKMEEIDQTISELAENWDFERIAKIDLTLLRVGIHELLHRPDVPPVVVINEIIDLGKAYSERKSKRFLNGILDKVLARLDRPHRESSI